MIEIPAFKAHLRAISVPGEGVLLLAEGQAPRVLGDSRLAQVASLIDGRRNANDIVRAVAGAVDAAVAWSVLMQLESDGWIEENRPRASRQEAAFWLTLGRDPEVAAAALASADVRVYATFRDIAERFGAALGRFGIAASTIDSIELLGAAAPDRGDAGLDVVLVEDYLSDSLLRVGEAARAPGRPWLLARPVGAVMWLGPCFGPGSAPCVDCMRRRLCDRSPAHRVAARHDPARGMSQSLGALAGTVETACLVTATEIAKMLAGSPRNLTGVIRTIDLRDWSTRAHRVIAHPACATCASRPESTLAPVELGRRRVAFDADGGFRTVSPEETVRAYEHLVSPLAGIVGSLVPTTVSASTGRNYVAADVRLARSDRISDLTTSFRYCSCGKGMTDAQARASGLCESIERYSNRIQGTEQVRSGTYRELGADAIHPNAVMHFSEAQYRRRDAWNEKHRSLFHFVPRPLEPDERIDWTPIWSLTAERHRLLPTQLLFRFDDNRGHDAIAPGCSNGCAAGNTIEEAVLQGFLELVERDAVAIWWYNRLRRPGIDIDSFDDPWLLDLKEHYRALGREVVALDLTNDLGIPVVAGISHRVEGPQQRIAIGYGCHLDARIAVQRALTESSQMLNIDLRGDAQAMREIGDGWMEWATLASQPYLTPDEAAPPRRRDDFSDNCPDDLLDCIECCRKVVETRGMEMLVLDQTRTDAGMPVARVVVPGLRHFWPRFGPGRLYDVPVTMGWLSAPLGESELNPVPFFF